ncbi:hypothetical protein [Acinetobacter sp.]|uniref:hypothetical protein n=1 Tax=Acinetobacter sp. TaxID=472 RepID=UPI00248A00FF|nr:hypothetical protein [Acinetobacter sp.]MDI1223686.1 hypothetical protein [Acinetobacter sp.]MDI1223697.1 hypothetical protein [Acinetobacter sp.]
MYEELMQMLEKYLEMLQQSSADDQDITDVKLMVWAIQKDIKIQRFINNLTVSNSYYRR